MFLARVVIKGDWNVPRRYTQHFSSKWQGKLKYCRFSVHFQYSIRMSMEFCALKKFIQSFIKLIIELGI